MLILNNIITLELKIKFYRIIINYYEIKDFNYMHRKLMPQPDGGRLFEIA
jgi:hypothetical protein